MRVKATVYTDADGRPRFVILPTGQAHEVGAAVDMGNAELQRWAAEQAFLSSLTAEQRDAYDKLQRAR
jgi:hypothetical protein